MPSAILHGKDKYNIFYDWGGNTVTLFHYPVSDVTCSRVEVDAHLCDRLAAEGEALGIVLEVDLLQGGLSVFVQLQFDDVETCVCQHHDIHPSLRRMHLHIHHISRKEREDDEEHLLVMSLVVGDIAVRHGAEEGLEPVSYTHLRAHETRHDLVCRLLLLMPRERT